MTEENGEEEDPVDAVVGGKSLELEEFMGGVTDQLEDTQQTLTQWFTQIQTIFYKVG